LGMTKKPDHRDLISELLKGAARPCILGAGSCLMADDAAGVMITDALIERFGKEPGRFAAFSGGTAPECFTGEIKKFNPDLVLIIDAADMGLAPGEVRSIEPTEVSGVSFSTHMLPLKVMLDYLNKEIGCRTAIVGIQSESLEFGGEMCSAVSRTVEVLIHSLASHLSSR
jgi:hydrogenase 3 maturation protease